VAEAYEKQIARVQAEHTNKEKELDAQRQKEWELALALKQRFAPMRTFTASFEEVINKVCTHIHIHTHREREREMEKRMV
jgi:hypothetical protein